MKPNVKHWTLQRLTAVPLVFLFFYFIWQGGFIATKSREVFVGWVKEPLTAGALALFIVCGFWHASFGVGEIIIDYVPSPRAQKAALLLSKLFFLLLGLACLYAVLAIKTGKY
ncbi:MAG: succinate dehydrogenase, hydrophobic membrane anchor protein [Alphaproteobacteria bacterium]|nr:succinate dehydrogenase, hydrophobic membrane anchor protein [Alphaproteobacteria bacterium]